MRHIRVIAVVAVVLVVLLLFMSRSAGIDAEVRFCPHEDCLALVLSTFSNAENSIDCAFYDLSDQDIISALDSAANADIAVKLVLDKKNEGRNLSRARLYNISGLMHNKFCVIDGKRVLTGSMNPTVRGHAMHRNNLLIIESRGLSRRYAREFEELWEGGFPGKSQFVPQIGDARVYFCPEDNCVEHVVETLRSAQMSIYMMSFTFTEAIIGTELILAHQRNVSVQVVVDPRQSKKYSQYHRLRDQGMVIKRYEGKGFQHNKVWVVDGQTVITGSMNPTWGATHRNAENLLIINDKGLAQRYLDAFLRVQNASKILK